jgi:hypothetical protein
MKKLLFSLAIFAACDPTPREPIAYDRPPEEFLFSQGHAFMGGETVEWREGKLQVTLFAPDGQERSDVEPSPEDWKRFWSRLEELGVWRWEAHYSDPERNQPDGVAWSLEIRRGDRSSSSRGYNAFPETFAGLREAIETELGARLSRPAARN